MDTNKTAPVILETKQHFEILDGLRGIAALAVVTFHFMEWAYVNQSKNFIGHGFLAVDFFFCLSGFVIGYAYDDRIAKMGVVEFFKSRIIRLHPLVVAGSVLGLPAFLLDPFGGHPELYSTDKIILTFFCSILLIPLPVMANVVLTCSASMHRHGRCFGNISPISFTRLCFIRSAAATCCC